MCKVQVLLSQIGNRSENKKMRESDNSHGIVVTGTALPLLYTDFRVNYNVAIIDRSQPTHGHPCFHLYNKCFAPFVVVIGLEWNGMVVLGKTDGGVA